MTGCRSGASRDDLCRRLPAEALIACRRQAGAESKRWRVDVILKADSPPTVRTRPRLGRTDQGCLEGALRGVRLAAGQPFATLQFELTRW